MQRSRVYAPWQRRPEDAFVQTCRTPSCHRAPRRALSEARATRLLPSERTINHHCPTPNPSAHVPPLQRQV